jgi:hypothetical protein
MARAKKGTETKSESRTKSKSKGKTRRGDSTPSIDTVVSTILKRTIEWGATQGLYPKGKEPSTKLTKVTKKLDKVLSHHSFAGHDQAIRDIISPLLEGMGESKLPPVRENRAISYNSGVVVVPLAGGAHPLGEPYLVVNESGGAVRVRSVTKKTDRQTMSANSDSVRLATELEISHLAQAIRRAGGAEGTMISLLTSVLEEGATDG